MAGQNKVDMPSLLSTAVRGVGSLLQNPSIEEAENDSDRVAASTTNNAGNLVQASVAPTMPFNPDFKNRDDFLSMSYSSKTSVQNPTKMVKLHAAQWLTNQPRTREVFRVPLPQWFFDADTKPAYGQAQFFSAVRCGFHIQVQLNVNMGTAGSLIVVYCPRTVFVNWDTYRFNAFTNLPHVIMNAATTSQADLYIPFVNHHNYARVNTDDLGYVFGYVWSALTAPSGAPTTVDVTVMGSILDLDLQNPRHWGSTAVDLLDEGPRSRKTKATRFKWVREKVDIAEGPGSMNLGNVLCTTGSQTTALVGERAFYDPRTAGAKCRVKDLINMAKLFSVCGPDQSSPSGSSNVTEPKGYFTWSGTQTPTTALHEYGIYLEDIANLNLFASSYAFWRGSLVVKLTIYATQFNKGRLRMAAYPNATASYDNTKVNNAIYTVCDIGLNNTFEMTIPYTWSNWMRPTRGSPLAWLRIDVLNRLTYNSAAPNSVNCILQMRAGDDAKFFIPTGSPYTWQGLTSWGSEMDLVDSLDNPEEVKDAAEVPDSSTNVEAAQGEEAATAVGLRATENDGSLSEQLNSNQPMFLNFVKQNVDIFSVSHTKVDHLFGRAWYVTGYNYSTDALQGISINFPTTYHAALSRFFAYFSGEVNFHFVNSTTTESYIGVTHTYFGDTHGISRVTAGNVSSSGMIIIPPNQQMSVCVPYYSESPLRCVKTTGGDKVSGLGKLFFKPYATGTPTGRVEIWASLRCPNFFFPVPAPKQATARSSVETIRMISNNEHLEAIAEAKNPNEPLLLKVKMVDPLDDLKKRALSWFNARQGSRSEDLLKAGDIESNPGPVFEVPLPTGDIGIVQFTGLIYQFSLRDHASGDTIVLSICEPVDNFLIRLILQFFHRRNGYRHDLLRQCGDVEMNPGPTIELVYKPRGFYKHYGVRVGDQIYHLDSHDILSTAFSGQAKFIKQTDDGNWQSSLVAPLDYFTEKYMNDLVGSTHIFSATTNCETIARDIFPGVKGITQNKALGIVGTILLSAGLLSILAVPFDVSSLQHVYNQSITQDASGLTVLTQRCMTFFSNTLAETLNNDLVKFIIKILVRLLCYIVLYCHAPNMLTTVCLGTLLVMDITTCEILSSGTKALFNALVEGDVKSLVSQIAESMQFAKSTDEQAQEMQETIRFTRDMLADQKEQMSNQGIFKDFNEVSMSFRHIEWWISVFRKIFSALRAMFSPSIEQKALKWIDARHDKIAAILDEASEILVLLKKPEEQRKPQNIQRYFECMDVMKLLVAIFVKVAPSTRFASTVFRMYSELLKINIKLPVNKDLTRLEPVGIWISGDPGQGKSFLTHALARKILTKTGLDGIFTNPTGSEYMDGYNGQAVHIIDDAGQNREEKDLALLCQCISSVPFTVPMAELSEKGTFYTSKFVIATTNRSDFVTNVLSDAGALSRRFIFKFRIRAKQCHCRDGKLAVARSMSAMADGSCWDFSRDNGLTWENIKLDDLVKMIVQEYDVRVESMKQWERKLNFVNQGIIDDMDATIMSLEKRFSLMAANIQDQLTRTADDLVEAVEDLLSPTDTPFACFERGPSLFPKKTASEKALQWVKNQCDRLKLFCEQNKGWIMFFSLLTSFLGILSLVYMYYKNSKDEPKAERPYNPQTMPRKGGKVAFPVKTLDFKNEAPYMGELEHCFAQTAYITSSTSDHPIHCNVLRDNQILLHGHSAYRLEQEDDLVLHFRGALFPLNTGSVSHVTLNGQKMDLVILKLDKLPICFKNYTKYYTDKIGVDNLLIWDTPQGRIAMPVTNVGLGGPLVTQEGTKTHKTFSYQVSTKRGMCGGLLVTKLEGAYKVLGVHIAGNGMIGMAAAVNFIKSGAMFKDEGIVLTKSPAQLPVFQNSRSMLCPSPLHGVFPVKMEPAVLSPKDPRLTQPLGSVVKTAAEKYRVNIFQVDQTIWMAVVDYYKQTFRGILGINSHVSFQEAICGTSKLASLDLSTSPGHKYVVQGLRKKDLVQLEPFWVSDKLVADVKEILGDVYSGKVPNAVFTAYLKDELRSLEKVAAGKTRCIEASSLDFVVAYRIIMSKIYDKIYQTLPQCIGLAVGMNPWTDWDYMIDSLYEFNYGLDYSRYDGSLSDELMRYGVEILAYCHDSPEQVMILHEPIINSVHEVMDEVWHVQGGMPSGAPCTTVLNSICNLLVCTYLAWVQDPDLKPVIITYGDDVIFSVNKPLDMDQFVQQAKQSFGMEITNCDKTPIPKLLQFEEIEFLKRSTKPFPQTSFKVGALNLDTLEQHIMWMKNMETFPQQLVSFCNELALHGPDVYKSYQCRIQPLLARWGLAMDDYPIVIRRMVGYVFE
nr:polyprotein [Parechovirus sp.]